MALHGVKITNDVTLEIFIYKSVMTSLVVVIGSYHVAIVERLNRRRIITKYFTVV